MIPAGAKSNLKQQEIKDLVAAFYKLLLEIPSKLQIQWAIPEEKNGAGLRTYFLENPPGIFHLFTLPQEFPDKSKLYPWKLFKTVLHLPWKFQDQQPRPLEIPHAISLISLEIPYHQAPVWIFTRIALCKEGVYLFSFDFGWYFIHLDCLLRTGGRSVVIG